MLDDNWIALTKCFYCGASNSIVMDRRLNRASNVKEKFHGKVANLTPCSNCAEAMKVGIMFIQGRDGELEKNVPLDQGGPYRTGRTIVIREDSARRMFGNEHAMFRSRWVFIEEKTWREIGFPEGDEDYSQISEAQPHWPTAQCKKCGTVRPVRPDWNDKPDKYTIKARCLTCHPDEDDQNFTLEEHEFHKYTASGSPG